MEEGLKNSNNERVYPYTINLYDINQYIIKPFTKISQKSPVEIQRVALKIQDGLQVTIGENLFLIPLIALKLWSKI